MVAERPITPEIKQPRGTILVLTGPSAGVGKDTITDKLLKETAISRIVTYTTRPPSRPTDKPGINYHFVSFQEFNQMKDNGEFLESNLLSGNWYGTAKRDVEAVLREGQNALLVVDINGVKSIKNYLREESLRGNPALKDHFVFVAILPPNYEKWDLASRTLARRIFERQGKERKTMSRNERHKEPRERLPLAKEEIEWLIQNRNSFDVFVVNERGKVDEAVEKILDVLKGKGVKLELKS